MPCPEYQGKTGEYKDQKYYQDAKGYALGLSGPCSQPLPCGQAGKRQTASIATELLNRQASYPVFCTNQAHDQNALFQNQASIHL